MANPSDAEVVRSFLLALAEGDATTALGLVTDDLEWRNTGLPALRGKRALDALKGMERFRIGFGVDIHDLTMDGARVLTRRTDHLYLGPVKQSFPVTGWFTLRDDKIAIWDDHFNWLKLLGGTRLRGKG